MWVQVAGACLLAVLALEPMAPRMQSGVLSLFCSEALVPLRSRCRQGLALGQLPAWLLEPLPARV